MNPKRISELMRKVASGQRVQLSDQEKTDPENYEIIEALVELRKQILAKTPILDREDENVKLILESTPIGICVTNDRGTFEYVNPAYCRVYDYRPEELLGHPFTIVVPDEFKNHMQELHDEFMGRRYELGGEWTVQRRDGTLINILANAAYVIATDGNPKKVTFIIDITDRKNAEDALKNTVDRLQRTMQEKEREMRARKEMERMLQHDLRNPVSGIIGLAELMLEESPTPELKTQISLVHESARNMLTMINSSLDYLKMEEGTYELASSPVNLQQILLDLQTDHRLQIRLKKIKIEYKDAGSDFIVYGEEIHLRNLFSNLMRNALDASPEGSTIAHVRNGFRTTFARALPAPG